MNLPTQKQQKLAYGKNNENRLIEYLNKRYPKMKYYLAQNKFDYFDFRCASPAYRNRIYELKSRKIYHNSFTTTMIGANKWGKAIKDSKNSSDRKYRVYYMYLDGLYKYDFNQKDIDDGILQLGDWSGWIDGKKVKNKVYYIPIEKLELVTINLCSELEVGDVPPQKPIEFSFCDFDSSDEE